MKIHILSFFLILFLTACAQATDVVHPVEPTQQTPGNAVAEFTGTPEPTSTKIPATETAEPTTTEIPATETLEPTATEIPTTETPKPTAAPECKFFSIFSKNLQEAITIKIALPDEYETDPEKEFTSIYLLDANYFFDDAKGTLDDLLERGPGMTSIVRDLTAKGEIPPSILIGVGYTEMQRMTFTMGRVEEFHRFFTKELIPQIESRCLVSKSGEDRVLFGYSASAHFSTFALMYEVYNDLETFDKFISISGPYTSSSAANKYEEKIFQELDKNAFSGRSLYIAVGADEPSEDLLANHREFTEKLFGRDYLDFRIMSTEFPGKGHYDIPEFAFPEGMIWLFSE